jgi:hypothetical protein
LQNLHPVGGQPDANFIQPDANFNQPDTNFISSAANGMQISFSQSPAGCKLHLAGSYPIQNTQMLQLTE